MWRGCRESNQVSVPNKGGNQSGYKTTAIFGSPKQGGHKVKGTTLKGYQEGPHGGAAEMGYGGKSSRGVAERCC